MTFGWSAFQAWRIIESAQGLGKAYGDVAPPRPALRADVVVSRWLLLLLSSGVTRAVCMNERYGQILRCSGRDVRSRSVDAFG